MYLSKHSMNKSLTDHDMSSSFFRKKQNTQKKKVIKKIIMISSIDKDIVKVLLKMMDSMPKGYSSDHKNKLIQYSKTILDKDKQNQLISQLEELWTSNGQENQQHFLKIIKYFILSPIQKNYITKIEQQLKEQQQLDAQISMVQQKINQQKNKKLETYYEEKKGKLVVQPKETLQTIKKDNINQQNKLERANQKLNDICANNNKLRQKINQLRKQKNVMEQIYTKLKKQLQTKKENVESTIKSAGQAYCARNQAQLDLQTLKTNAETQKDQFKQECQKLNKQIQYDIRFKQFIKSKQKQKATLAKLQQQIRRNEQSIEQKKQSNLKIQSQYKQSVAKENQIKKSFERIKKEIGITEVGIESSGKQLLSVFVGLYEKNAIMGNFVSELNKQVESLEAKIAQKKMNIDRVCSKQNEVDAEQEKTKQDMKRKVQVQQRRKTVLKQQYEKSVQAIAIIKQYLQESFQEIGVERQTIQKLKSSSITEENLTQFLGQLEKRGIEAISKYSKLVSEHIKAENADVTDIQNQINDLNNIIIYDNASVMNTNFGDRNILNQYPSQLLLKVKDDENIDQKNQMKESRELGAGIWQRDDFKKFALQSLENFNKKTGTQLHREKSIGNKKFIINNNSKSKKK